jgi:hypothetical protein
MKMNGWNISRLKRCASNLLPSLTTGRTFPGDNHPPGSCEKAA